MKGPAKEIPRHGGITYEQKFFSQIWDAVFDSIDLAPINNADSIGELLVKYLGFLGVAGS
jgi:hypothetical protein